MNNESSKKQNILHTLGTLVRRPLQGIKKFGFSPNYHPESYWKARHRKHGFSLRGVGNWTQSHEVNQHSYTKQKATFLEFCKENEIDFKGSRILDVGCGTGFFAEVMRDNGGSDYLGIDITDELFEGVSGKFPEFRFKKMDITTDELEGQFDLIIMISVAQHIVDEEKFSFAMQNIRTHLSENGTFIITLWDTDCYVHPQPHVVGRPLSYLEKEFKGDGFSKPKRFGPKNLFAIRKHT